jgi:hypothetical protein
MDTISFTTLPLEYLNLHIFDVKLLQKPHGKNMRSILLYNPSKIQWKMKVSILDTLWTTSTTQWDKLGETPPTYFMSLVSLYKKPW